MDLTRRQWILGAASAGASVVPVGCTRVPQSEIPEAESDTLARFPGKVAMRVVNNRPQCLETPWRYFQHDLTPNEAFYVRCHLQTVPAAIDVKAWRLRIDGAVDRPLELSMDELRRLGSDEMVAVNQCSGNSRSLFGPRVPGAQWRNGAMGNARWAGVGLAKVLRAAGVRRDAVQVTFDGMDEGPLSSVPDFVKALDIDHALEPEVMVAYSMNGAPLPALNGFPARLVVPGWYATYWVKALYKINVLPHFFDGYWMAKAYKIPANPNGIEDPNAKLTDHLIPINRMNVRSFVTTPEAGSIVAAGRTVEVDGIAFDGGSGIRGVELSGDDGTTWAGAVLGDDLGRYSFRRWRYRWTPVSRGNYRLRSRATAGDGQVQPQNVGWNRGGFMRNAVEEVPIHVV
jgi:sulfite dehydrogenase (cytochrome) subunit A